MRATHKHHRQVHSKSLYRPFRLQANHHKHVLLVGTRDKCCSKSETIMTRYDHVSYPSGGIIQHTGKKRSNKVVNSVHDRVIN